MPPTISSARHVRDVHGPAFIAPLRAAPAALDARPRRCHTLMHEPPFQLKYAINRLAIYSDPFAKAEQCPQPPITKRRIRFDQTLKATGQDFIEPSRLAGNYRARPQPGTGKLRTRHTLRIDAPGNVVITRRTFPAS